MSVLKSVFFFKFNYTRKNKDLKSFNKVCLSWIRFLKAKGRSIGGWQFKTFLVYLKFLFKKFKLRDGYSKNLTVMSFHLSVFNKVKNWIYKCLTQGLKYPNKKIKLKENLF